MKGTDKQDGIDVFFGIRRSEMTKYFPHVLFILHNFIHFSNVFEDVRDFKRAEIFMKRSILKGLSKELDTLSTLNSNKLSSFFGQ